MNQKVQRHTWGLREALFQEWDAMRAGKIDAKRAMASAKLAQVILNSVEVEMAYVAQVNRAREGDQVAIAREIRLGPA